MNPGRAITRRGLVAAAGLALPLARARAEPRPLRVGVLTDLSGDTADASGSGSVEAARMAAEEVGSGATGRPIEIVFADHRQSVPAAEAILRGWFDTGGVAAVANLPGAAVAGAVQRICRDRGRIALFSGFGDMALSNRECSPTGFQWTCDTYSVAAALGQSVIAAGGESWFLLVGDDAESTALRDQLTAIIQEQSAVLRGVVLHPSGGADVSAQIRAAVASGAHIVALCSASRDAAIAILQAGAVGLAPGQLLVAPTVTLTDVNRLGLAAAHGVLLAEPFYWNTDESSRAWSRQFFRRTGRMPGPYQIGTYEAVRHYLLAYGASATGEAADVAKRMRYSPIESPFTHGARIRADGRVLRSMRVEHVKSPGQSVGPWDDLSLDRIVGSESLVWPSTASTCKLLDG
jgi:branched-chain amino acid transport system substrate-binding protein